MNWLDESGNWAEAEQTRVPDDWARAIAEFEQEVGVINEEIADLNLKVPRSQFQRYRVDAAREIERMTEESVK